MTSSTAGTALSRGRFIVCEKVVGTHVPPDEGPAGFGRSWMPPGPCPGRETYVRTPPALPRAVGAATPGGVDTAGFGRLSAAGDEGGPLAAPPAIVCPSGPAAGVRGPAASSCRTFPPSNYATGGRKAAAVARLKRLQGRLLFLLDLEDLVNLRVDVAQDQPAADALELLVEGDELAERGAGEVFDVAEVEEELLHPLLVDEAEELLADDLDVLLVEDLTVHEVDDGHIADLFDLEATTARL